MRDLTTSTTANFELALQGVKKTKFWSKAAQKDAEALLHELEQFAKQLKDVLMKHSNNLEMMKEVVIHAAQKVKEACIQIKEFKLLINKTSSKASGRK